MKKRKKHFEIVIIVIIILSLFGVINTKIYTNDYSNINTFYKWLTADTIKFTNNWLAEGALNLNFIMYENQDSIEYNELNERNPYISYPSGSIIIPYVIAKILNIQKIDYIFVKYMVTAMFAIDSVLIGILCYMILRKISSKTKFDGSVILAIMLAVLWMIIPVISYYLRNIYFADQAVITIVLIFMILESQKDKIKNRKARVIYNVIYYLTIIFGVITDYYFCFVVFTAFCIRCIPIITKRESNKKEKIKKVVKSSLEYTIPVFIGIGMFLLQIMQVENWQAILTDRFLERTSSSVSKESSLKRVIRHIIITYTKEGSIVLLLGIGLTIIMSVIAVIKICKKKSNNRIDEICKLGILIYVPAIMQILIFKNHSAVHDFSIIKLGLPLLFSIIIIGTFLYKILEYTTNKKSNLIFTFAIASITLFSIATISSKTAEYIERYTLEEKNYELEHYLKENAKYEEVYISYTYEIPTNPPDKSAISGKNVYKINKISDIYEKFPNLNDNAKIILVIEKEGKTIIEDDYRYIEIAELGKYKLCEVEIGE